LSICYAAPGHFLLPEVGPSLNVLSVAEELSKTADVTLAFRKVIQPPESPPFTILELDPECDPSAPLVDDSAVRGTSLSDLLRYLLVLRSFADRQWAQFDIVLEKSWLLAGYLAQVFQRYGVPGILVENLIRTHAKPHSSSVRKYLGRPLLRGFVRHYARKASMVIAETTELKAAMTELWRIPADRIEVAALGVDTRLFYPRDQLLARQALGIDASVMVLLYVGVLDEQHDLAPILQALNRFHVPALELRVVGDGLMRRAFEEIARQGNAAVRFHSRVPHGAVAQFIAASDLCLAPYNPQAFFNGEVSFTPIKILEYMACARPAVSVPNSYTLKLIQHGINGFLFPNEIPLWTDLLRSFPRRGELKEMGIAALGAVSDFSWEKTAAAYLRVCERVIQSNVGAMTS